VLTIFMVIQFVLRETITGQATQLDTLAAEVSSLTAALGLEQSRTAGLTADLDDARDTGARQASLIDTLTADRDRTVADLTDAENRITGFEAQVAGLLAERRDDQAQIADLQQQRTTLIGEQEALNLALSTARSEVDAQAEAARLAAARREALQAMVADLQTGRDADAEAISRLEADSLVDAAAAEALRARLADADTELTAMTLALEEQRRDAEETLTLLAASQAARDDLGRNLAAALLAQQQAENDLSRALQTGDDLDERLLAALSLQDNTAAELAAARAALDAADQRTDDLTTRLAAAVSANQATSDDLKSAQDALQTALRDGDVTQQNLQAQLAAALLAQEAARIEAANATQGNATLEDRLAEAVLARDALATELAGLTDDGDEITQDRATLQARLAAALSSRDTAQSDADRQAALLATANAALTQEEVLSADAQRQAALLNEQVAALRRQVASLQTLLDVADDADTEAQVRIEALGAQLNTALARVAAEERRRRTLEEAERARLEEEAAALAAQAQNLERFRSDFFGQMRDVLEGQDGVRIEGDRFVFSSEVLFDPGAASLSPQGQGEIANVAALLRGVIDQIPDDIDWIIRVDGHTDDIPLSGQGEFADNWELSQARALSVVRYMERSLGIPPTRLSANGFGEYQPLDTADTTAARAQNRRIELKLTER